MIPNIYRYSTGRTFFGKRTLQMKDGDKWVNARPPEGISEFVMVTPAEAKRLTVADKRMATREANKNKPAKTINLSLIEIGSKKGEVAP